jgi:hypothetical protein
VVGLLCAAAVTWANAAADNDDAGEDAQDAKPFWTSRGHKATPGASFYVISVPHPIGGEEWRMYAAELVLSDAQREQLRELYETYLEEDRAYRAESVQPLWERSGEIAASNDLCTNEATANRFAELMADRGTVLPGLRAIEKRLFEGIGAYLSEEQLQLLEHVRKQRRRARCNAAHCRFPGGMTDVSVMLHRALEEGLDVTPRDPEMFQLLMEEYDSATTPLFEKRLKANLRVQTEGNVLMARAAELWAGFAPGAEAKQAAEEIDRDRRALNRQEMRAARRIQELNRMYLRLLTAELPAVTRRLLVDRFNESTYPVVYPDPYNVEVVLEVALALPDLDDKQNAELTAVHELYEGQQDEVTNQMRKRYLDWKMETGVISGYGFDEYDAYTEAMRKLQRSRQALAEMALTMVRDTLTEQQMGEIAPKVTAWKDRVEAFEAHDESIRERFHLAGWQWPRPYD